MPATEFNLAVVSRVFTYQGKPMNKRRLPRTELARVRAGLKWLNRIIASDAKPAAKSRKTAKIKVFDPATAGLVEARDVVVARLAELLTPANS